MRMRMRRRTWREGQGEGGEQGQGEGEEQGQEDVIELSSDDHPQQWAEQMEIDEGHGQADFTAQAAEGQGEGADPSDDESVFSADLLRWADEQTETQAAAQFVTGGVPINVLLNSGTIRSWVTRRNPSDDESLVP
ncbi:hypothetical protein AcV5_006801 [Taiwanofungus camphoratus]|nr:hypothetical protein AcV5_006801 [Antrodia cinnamomea]